MTDAAALAPTPDGGALDWASTGDGEPMLLVAGQAVSRHSWDPLLPRFAERFRTVVFDHRGIGDSPEGEAPPRTIAGFADDALRVMDAAGIARAHVVGHSMGGRIAQRLALAHPERLRSLTLIATTGGDARFPRSPEATADLAGGDPARLGRRFFAAEYLAAHPDAIDVFVRREGGVRTRRRHYEASVGHEAWDELAGLAVPTLVVHGEADTVTVPTAGRALAEAIPGARLLLVPGGGHAVQLDHPGVVSEIIAFAESCGGG